MEKIPAQEKLVLLLDALDQLSDNDPAHNLTWLPLGLPENIKVIVSTLSGKFVPLLKRMVPVEGLKRLEFMAPPEGVKLLKAWLRVAGRTLQDIQAKEVLEKFAGNGLPLYLKLSFEEARLWKSYSQNVDLSPDIPGIIREYFRRLSLSVNHGSVLVSHSMGYLAASKNGLTEDELLDVLSLDATVYKDFAERAHHEPAGARLPVVVWLRLYHDLGPYLTERTANGTSLLSFYHKQLAEVASDLFLKDGVKQERHGLLAGYFEKQPLWRKGQEKRIPNVRKVSELPYQQTYGELWDAIEKTLCDLYFVEAKCAAGMTGNLISDYRAALDVLPENRNERERAREKDESLKEYEKALIAYAKGETENLQQIPEVITLVKSEPSEKRERIENAPSRIDRIRAFLNFVSVENNALSNFASQPGFCIQQAYNNPLYGVVAEAAQCIIADDTTNRMILKNPVKRVSHRFLQGSAMKLEGHSGPVNCIALSTDAKYALSGGEDKTVRLWNLETGECLFIFRGHSARVTGIDMTPDTKIAASTSYDETVRLWDLETRKCLKILKNDFKSDSVSISADGGTVISVGESGWKIWWPYKGLSNKESLEQEPLYMGKLSSNGQKAYVLNQKKIAVYIFYPERILQNEQKEENEWFSEVYDEEWFHHGSQCLDMTPDCRRALYGGRDGVIRLYDLEKHVLQEKLWGHVDAVSSVSMTPDGCRAVSGSDDETLRVWDLEHGICLARLKGNDARVTAVKISADGRKALSSDHGGSIHLWDLENLGMGVLSGGHKEAVSAADITPDGLRAVTVSGDRTLRLWDVKNNNCLKYIPLPDEAVTKIAISADARMAVTGDIQLKVWDLEKGTCAHTLKGHLCGKPMDPSIFHTDRESDDDLRSLERYKRFISLLSEKNSIVCLHISDDGRKAFSADSDTLKVWDLKTGRCLQTLTGKKHNFDWSSAEQILKKIADTTDEAREERLSFFRENFKMTPERKPRTKRSEFLKITCASMTPDGGKAITGALRGELRVWDLERGECLEVLKTALNRKNGIVWVDLTSDGQAAVSCDNQGRIILWDLDTGKVRTVVEQGSSIEQMALFRQGFISDDAKRIVASTTTEDIFVWDEIKATRHKIYFDLRVLRGHRNPVGALTVTSDGRKALSGSVDGMIKTWDLDTGRSLDGNDEHTGPVMWSDSTPDGKMVVSGSEDQIAPFDNIQHKERSPVSSIRFWRGSDGVYLSNILTFFNSISTVMVSPDGTRVFYGYGSEILCSGIEKDKKQKTFHGHAGKITAIALLHDGMNMVSASVDGTIRLWEIKTSKCLKTFNATGSSTNNLDFSKTLDISPDGRMAVSSDGSTLKMWDLASGDCVRQLVGHEGDIRCVRVSPDAKRVVSAGEDKTVRVWDMKTGSTRRIITAHEDTVVSLRISPDGKWALSVNDDKTIKAWSLESGDLLAVYKANNALKGLSKISPLAHFACGSYGGELLFLTGFNFQNALPWVTSYRVDGRSIREKILERFGVIGYFGTLIERKIRRLSDNTAARCPWCGQVFLLTLKLFKRIQVLNGGVGVSPAPIPCLSLPDESWQEPSLFSECPQCHKPIKFNPFIVDYKNFH